MKPYEMKPPARAAAFMAFMVAAAAVSLAIAWILPPPVLRVVFVVVATAMTVYASWPALWAYYDDEAGDDEQ